MLFMKWGKKKQKNIKKCISKSINYESRYNREKSWDKNDQEEFENEMKKIEEEIKR